MVGGLAAVRLVELAEGSFGALQWSAMRTILCVGAVVVPGWWSLAEALWNWQRVLSTSTRAGK